MTDQRCRICGCTETRACLVDGEPCGWADTGRTLCDNPNCMHAAATQAGERARARLAAQKAPQ